MSSFVENLKNELKSEKILTENGATAYKTSGTALVDLNFAISTFRNGSDADIISAFTKAYFENKELAVRWLFFARDVRGGCGERRLFRVCFKWLADNDAKLVNELIPLTAEYGRFDDLFALEGTDCWKTVVDFVFKQLTEDIEHCDAGKSISLLCKWMPSITTSSAVSRALAKRLCRDLGMKSDGQYRKTLSRLRAYDNVVETKISANKWSEVDYEAVPSMANVKYKNAFIKHDKVRRSEYLAKLERGEAKINSSAAFPCDIVSRYGNNRWSILPYDATLEGMWKALPNYVKDVDNGNTIVVVDGSGSMTASVGSTGMSALDVAQSLAVYFSERMTESPYKDKFITFSERPQLIDLSKCNSLHDKIKLLYAYDECSNTNIEATFDLLLNTAVNNHVEQKDIPNVLIVSDMNFDQGTSYHGRDVSLMESIAKKWEAAGYKMPRLTYWNVIGGYGRTAPVPVQQSESGVALVSGFSPAIASMVYSAKTDPYDVLVEKLMSDRYAPIGEIVGRILN